MGGALAGLLGLLLVPAPAPIQLAARARAQQPGELVVLEIRLTGAAQPLRVRAFERDHVAYPTGAHVWRALVGIDLDVKPGRYPVEVEAGSGSSRLRASYPLTIATRRFRTRRLTVDEAFVTPPTAVQDRIEREAKRLASVWDAAAAERLWTTFVAPVAQPANSAFGTRSVFNGQPKSPHAGADFPSPAGTPIKAPGAGRIVIAEPLYFSGNTLVIDHGLGLFSLLAHLSEFAVRAGEEVAAGQVVGRVGATGRVTGPHLHWAVRVNGARVDPLSVVSMLGAGPRRR
jgi:murein DD-endopeptidase MepM/ murein hydrolase activator NlpD